MGINLIKDINELKKLENEFFQRLLLSFRFIKTTLINYESLKNEDTFYVKPEKSKVYSSKIRKIWFSRRMNDDFPIYGFGHTKGGLFQPNFILNFGFRQEPSIGLFVKNNNQSNFFKIRQIKSKKSQ